HAYCLKTQPATGETYPKSDLFNKAHQRPKETERRAVRTVAAAMDLKSATIVEINVEPWLANVNSLTRQD
ncbi:hypothetical protein ACOY39_27270, partial [Klebsiella pneumoniae]|uniref:hypothetical protein n=1 Tax=Klebsiella pneumoniae TaxID=573 RepID=UPI003BEBD116